MHPIERAVAALEANAEILRRLLEGEQAPQEVTQSLAEAVRCEQQTAIDLRRLL